MVDLTYSTGTVSVSGGGTVVTGAGGYWSSSANVRQWDAISINGAIPVLITGVTDDTHLTIPAWQGATQAAVPYVIYQLSPLRFAGGLAMADVSAMIAAFNSQGFYWFVGPALSSPDPSYGEEGQFARQSSTGKEWLKTGGVWVYQGVTGNLNVSSAPYSASTTYSANVIVPFAGKLWLSLQPLNQNNRPDISPTWWLLFMSGGDAYDVVSFDTDRPADGELVLKIPFTKTVTFYAGLSDSRANSDVGATLNSVYSYRKNGIQFATLTFAAGGQAGPQSGTFASVADTVFAAGDVLTMYAPATRDQTLSGIGATLSGYRN
nr:MAG TPA: hypothetical protein [Caudoviricetes sp.]